MSLLLSRSREGEITMGMMLNRNTFLSQRSEAARQLLSKLQALATKRLLEEGLRSTEEELREARRRTGFMPRPMEPWLSIGMA